MSGEGGDGFLSRWSRLKREADKAPDRQEAAAEDIAAPVDADAPFDPTTLDIPLPSLDALQPGDSLKAFMQKGVPEALKNAALRKMWALDPMVRDFRSEALDYAWDWNTPGGVPGTGPLGAADKVEEMVDAIFRAFDPPPEPETASADDPPSDGEAKAADGTATPDPAASASREASEPPATQTRRHHGGAMPQSESVTKTS